MKRLIAAIGLLLVVSLAATDSPSAQAPSTCVVYFTGVGCPHCAKTDPVVLGELPGRYPNLYVIEYEIYQQRENAPLMYQYHEAHGSGLGVPQAVLEAGDCVVGDKPILERLEACIQDHAETGTRCQLLGEAVSFEDLDLTELPGSPKIWHDGRVLIKKGDGQMSSDALHDLLTADDPGTVAVDAGGTRVEASPVALSGASVSFERQADLEGWSITWNDDWAPPDVEGSEGDDPASDGGNESAMPMNPLVLIAVAFAFVAGLGTVKKLRGDPQ